MQIFFHLLLLCGLCYTQPAPNLIIQLFRHGSRAPTSNQYDPSWPTTELGELTYTGMREHYLLGLGYTQEYTNRYNSSFLPSSYSPSQIYARSTSLNRT